jgi:GNAT superfamily N-acetyltransferase
MQGWLRGIAEGSPSHPDELMYAVATREDESGDQEIIGWAGINVWAGLPSLQAFVLPEYRGLSLATALSAAMLIEARPPGPVAVFSDACYRIGKRLNLGDVRLYKSVDDGWIRVSTEALDAPRNGTAGVHDPSG